MFFLFFNDTATTENYTIASTLSLHDALPILKALSMVRNVARQKDEEIRHFATLVCDLADLPDEFQLEAKRGSAEYYFRPWKTLLVRTVADGGESFYVKGSHAETIQALWTALTK